MMLSIINTIVYLIGITKHYTTLYYITRATLSIILTKIRK